MATSVSTCHHYHQHIKITLGKAELSVSLCVSPQHDKLSFSSLSKNSGQNGHRQQKKEKKLLNETSKIKLHSSVRENKALVPFYSSVEDSATANQWNCSSCLPC